MNKQTQDNNKPVTKTTSKVTQQLDKQPKNEGEGSYTGTKKYDAGVRDFVKSGAVETAAKDAEAAVDGAEGASLTEAETIGKRGGSDVERGSDTKRGKA
jgi:hypothetical protein